jgi:chromatin remodeling complex protein RSC6
MNDQRLEEFLGKLKNILLDEKMQKILEASDKGIN